MPDTESDAFLGDGDCDVYPNMQPANGFIEAGLGEARFPSSSCTPWNGTGNVLLYFPGFGPLVPIGPVGVQLNFQLSPSSEDVCWKVFQIPVALEGTQDVYSVVSPSCNPTGVQPGFYSPGNYNVQYGISTIDVLSPPIDLNTGCFCFYSIGPPPTCTVTPIALPTFTATYTLVDKNGSTLSTMATLTQADCIPCTKSPFATSFTTTVPFVIRVHFRIEAYPSSTRIRLIDLPFSGPSADGLIAWANVLEVVCA